MRHHHQRHAGRVHTRRKTTRGAGRRRKRMKRYSGAGLGKWLKKAFHKLGKVAKPVYRFIKKHKLLSKGLAMIPDGRAKGAAVIARQLGLGHHGGALRLAGAGKRRRMVRRKPRYYTRGYGLQP